MLSSAQGCGQYVVDLAYLASDTPIKTGDGIQPIDSLKSGDYILTYYFGVQKIRAISALPALEVQMLRPLAISLANGDELRLTSASQILAATPWCELLFGVNEALIPADSLLGDPLVNPITAVDRPYYTLHLDRPDFIHAGGVLWMAAPDPATCTNVVPFPQRLPCPQLDHTEARFLYRCVASLDKMLKTE